MSSSQKTIKSRLFKAYKIFSIVYTTFSVAIGGTLMIALIDGGYKLRRKQEQKINDALQDNSYYDTCY